MNRTPASLIHFCATSLSLFSAVLLGASSNAWASIITYNVVDYPGDQRGLSPYSGVAHVVGSTITVNTGATTLTNTGIPIPFTDIVAATLVFETSLGTYSASADLIPPGLPFGGYSDGENLMASATQLYLNPSPDQSFLDLHSGGNHEMTLYYYEPNGIFNYSTYQAVDPFGQYIWAETPLSNPGPSYPGAYIGSSPMIIAQVGVPEPGTLLLVCWALLGLAGAVYLRWRRGEGLTTANTR